MELTELTIHGFRAFPPEERTLSMDGDSSAIVGDNGTGKSSLLGAIEFLVTGGMTHLGGAGTDGIEVRSHAPHRDADPEECYVRGTFVAEDGEEGTFERRASDPTDDPERVSGTLSSEDVNVSQWNDEHLILTRRQLLKFIESSPGSRADSLSSLLNLRGVQNRADGFQRIKQRVESTADSKERHCGQLVEDIGSTLGLDLSYPLGTADQGDILDAVNERLALLDADELSSIDELTSVDSLGLAASEDSLDAFYDERVRSRLRSLESWIEENRDDVEQKLDDLTETLAEVDALDSGIHSRIDLFDAAQRLVASTTTECPLCGATHPEGYLHSHVSEARENMEQQQQLRTTAEESADELREMLETHADSVASEIESLDEDSETGDHPEVDSAVARLQSYLDEVYSIVDTIEQHAITGDDDELLVDVISSVETPAWDEVQSSAQQIREYMGDLEPRRERVEASHELQNVSDDWTELTSGRAEHERLDQLSDEMEVVVDLFAEAQEEVLVGVYDDIEESFNDYYMTVHPDEQSIDFNFDGEMTDSVELEASFEGERDSPLAYHSEGHIDTMGICLFLALRERLNTAGPDIVMLDDVVMSVDKTHRRRVAKLLEQYLDEGPQAVITTHDEVWADQLKERAVVPRGNEFRIDDWNIATGPLLRGGSGNPAWEVIEEHLDDGEPHRAAAHLRRQAEKICHQAAVSLRPRMEFKERHSLADYVNGMSGKIKSVTKNAKQQFNNGDELFESACDLSDRKSELIGNLSYAELNSMVHYNREEWGQLAADDLRDVLEFWKEFEEFFYCDTCNSMIQYSRDGDWRWLHCDCREVQVGYED